MIHWLAYWTGLTNGSGPRYLWWSGIGSDIGEVALLGGLLSIARHSNCHAKRCWRFGKPVDGTPYRACHRHHPAHDGEKRNVPLETITDAHRDAR